MASFRYRAGRRWLLQAGLATFAVVLAAQQPSTYSVEVKVVNVLATVRDKHGKIVNNLSQDDFTLDEDGYQQTIKYFSRETDLPLTLGLLVDTSLSQRRVLDKERSASGSFADQVLREDKDKAFLIHFDREVELLQDLTSSRQKLQDGLRLLQTPAPEQDRSAGGGGGGGGGYPGGGGSGRGGHSRRHGGGTLLYDSVYLASDELMQKQRGRKAIVILTDGVDQGSKMSLDRAIESAQRARSFTAFCSPTRTPMAVAEAGALAEAWAAPGDAQVVILAVIHRAPSPGRNMPTAKRCCSASHRKPADACSRSRRSSPLTRFIRRFRTNCGTSTTWATRRTAPVTARNTTGSMWRRSRKTWSSKPGTDTTRRDHPRRGMIARRIKVAKVERNPIRYNVSPAGGAQIAVPLAVNFTWECVHHGWVFVPM